MEKLVDELKSFGPHSLDRDNALANTWRSFRAVEGKRQQHARPAIERALLLKGSGTVLAQPERNSMDSKNILGNEVAMAILNDTVTRLRAIGVHCLVSPMSLPQDFVS